MDRTLRLILLIFCFFWFFILFFQIKKNKISTKYAIIWFFAILVILISIILSSFIQKTSNSLHFFITSNFIIGVILTVLMGLTMILTIIVSKHEKIIIKLTQEVSLLKQQIGEKEVK